jgi:plasmid stabilization system protein ParE
MRYHIRLSEEAVRDLYEARLWYREQANLDLDFYQAVRATLDQIERMPKMYQLVYRDVRRAAVKRFPYLVFFRVLGEVVKVIAVVHHSRCPSHWIERS